MDYEQKYKEALERAKEFISNRGIKPDEDAFKCAKELSETIFPELAESEDEKIRKEMLDFFNQLEDKKLRGVDISSWISWLEKQGKQKPAWSEEDEWKRNELLQYLKEKGDYRSTWYSWLKSIKDRVQPQPKQEWSEEDVRNVQDIDSVLYYDKNLPEDTRIRLRNWLKSLKSQQHWKPSKYDISLLEEIAGNIRNDVRPFCSEVSALEDLIEKIKNFES